MFVGDCFNHSATVTCHVTLVKKDIPYKRIIAYPDIPDPHCRGIIIFLSFRQPFFVISKE